MASLAFKGSVDMEDILSACSWEFHSTFTDFYLRDIALLTGLHHLGPIIAAQLSIMLHDKVLLLGIVGVFFFRLTV